MTETKDTNHSSGQFFNGFLLGIIVGAAIVFFLGTQKGKKLLKLITEEGREAVSGIMDIIEDSSSVGNQNLEKRVKTQKTALKKTQRQKLSQVAEGDTDSIDNSSEEQVSALYQDEEETSSAEYAPHHTSLSHPRRFFKGVHRRN